MSEKEIVKAIKEHIKRQDDGWKFIMGRQVLTKETFLEKLEKDKAFQRTVIKLVYNLSIDILARKKNE